MASSRLAYIFLVACSLQLVFCSEHILPVYMWGDLEITSQKANPLVELSEEDYTAVLKDQFDNDPFTLVFIENSLSVEDLSRRNAEGKSSFPYLQSNLGDALYLPAVRSPMKTLNEIVDQEKVDHVKLTENGLSAELESDDRKFLFVALSDAKEGESRADMLRRHNDFMEEMYAKLQEKYDKVVGIYTAQYPSWTVEHSRIRRQAASNPDVIRLPNTLFYVKNITVVNDNVPTVFAQTGGDSSFDAENRIVTANINSAEGSLTLTFTQHAGYWYLNQVTAKVGSEVIDAVRSEQIYAVNGFSYRCSGDVVFNGVNTTKSFSVVFNDMQIQPFDEAQENAAFGDAYFCVGFTSVPIWACLFVVAILLSIMFYGVMMMMDIRTMDRFDDPKGKTITINAGE